MRSPFRVAAAALAATLIIAACGSDEPGSSAGDATPAETIADVDTTVATTTPDTTPDTSVASSTVPDDATQDVAADTATAEAALLTLADLPEGWTETPADDDASAALTGRLAECAGVEGDEISAADATAATGRFDAAEGTASVSQHVGVLATENEARSVVAFTAEPDVLVCFETVYAELGGDLFTATLAEGAQVGTPSAARLQVGSVGDATQAIRVIVPVTGDPSVVEMTVDHVLMRSGRSLSTLTISNSTEATPVETIDGYTAIVAERLPV